MHRLSVSSLAGDGASVWDRLGLALSGLCAVHCLLMPFALVVLSVWPAALDVEAWLHPLFAALLIPTTLMAIRIALRHRHARPIPLLLAGGLLLVLGAMVLGEVAGAMSEAAVTVLGSSLLIVGHWRNGHACTHEHDPLPLAGHPVNAEP